MFYGFFFWWFGWLIKQSSFRSLMRWHGKEHAASAAQLVTCASTCWDSPSRTRPQHGACCLHGGACPCVCDGHTNDVNLWRKKRKLVENILVLWICIFRHIKFRLSNSIFKYYSCLPPTWLEVLVESSKILLF